jgi:hypothetical protein
MGRTRRMRVTMPHVMFDPMPMIVRFVADGADWARDRARRDRRADLHHRPLPRVPVLFQIVAVLRRADGGAAGRPREMAGRDAGARPSRLVKNAMPVVFDDDASLRGSCDGFNSCCGRRTR